VACLCNFGNSDPEKRATEVAEAYLGNLMKPKETKKEAAEQSGEQKAEIPLSAQQLQAYAGDYFSDELRITYRLEIAERKLRITYEQPSGAFDNFENDQATYLRPTAAGEFEAGKTGVTLHFERDAKQGMKGFTVDAGRTRGILFTRVAIAKTSAKGQAR
jgi:hypothetical protein